MGRVGGGGVGTGKGTGKSMRTRLSKLPFGNLPFSNLPFSFSAKLLFLAEAREPCRGWVSGGVWAGSPHMKGKK